jgi:hypothetical protein
MAKLKQPFCADPGMGARAGALDVDTRSPQVINPHQMLIERRFKHRPTALITQETQDNCEPIIAKLMSPHDLACDLTQDDLSLGHPRLDMDEPMIPSRENRTQPDRRHATKGQTLPVAMGRKMGVKQRRSSHPIHLRQQQRNVIDTLGDNVQFLMHPQSLTQSGIYLQICPNGKICFRVSKSAF